LKNVSPSSRPSPLLQETLSAPFQQCNTVTRSPTVDFSIPHRNRGRRIMGLNRKLLTRLSIFAALVAALALVFFLAPRRVTYGGTGTGAGAAPPPRARTLGSRPRHDRPRQTRGARADGIVAQHEQLRAPCRSPGARQNRAGCRASHRHFDFGERQGCGMAHII